MKKVFFDTGMMFRLYVMPGYGCLFILYYGAVCAGRRIGKLADYRKPSSSLASSLIISLVHSGSNTTLIVTDFMPSMDSSFMRASSTMKSAIGQDGAVMVMSIVRSPESERSILSTGISGSKTVLSIATTFSSISRCCCASIYGVVLSCSFIFCKDSALFSTKIVVSLLMLWIISLILQISTTLVSSLCGMASVVGNQIKYKPI